MEMNVFTSDRTHDIAEDMEQHDVTRRVNVQELKEKLLSEMNGEEQASYMTQTRLFFTYKITKVELDASLRPILTGSKLRLHNSIIRGILHNALSRLPSSVPGEKVLLPKLQTGFRDSFLIVRAARPSSQRNHAKISEVSAQSLATIQDDPPTTSMRPQKRQRTSTHRSRTNLSRPPLHQKTTEDPSAISLTRQAQIDQEREEERLYDEAMAERMKIPLIPPADLCPVTASCVDYSDMSCDPSARPGLMDSSYLDTSELVAGQPIGMQIVQRRMQRAACMEGGIRAINREATEVATIGLQEHLKEVLSAAVCLVKGRKRDRNGSSKAGSKIGASVKTKAETITMKDLNVAIQLQNGRVRRQLGGFVDRLNMGL